jgi:hypothetical protein
VSTGPRRPSIAGSLAGSPRSSAPGSLTSQVHWPFTATAIMCAFRGPRERLGTISRAVFLGCAMLVVLVWLQACGQTNSSAERQEQKEGMEPIKEKAEEVTLPSYDVTAD